MFDFFVDLGGFIMWPLYWITSVILSGFHQVLTPLLGADSGWSWVLSIVGLTLVIRAALIPLFVKQIKSSRNMQLIQPKVRELQKKYGHDRERLAQETMKLYKDTGTNPFASCLPILVQMPIFLALFRLIDRAANGETRGVLTDSQVDSLSNATWLGAQIADRFTGDGGWEVKVLAAILVIAMSATTFLTQRQLMSKNMPADALTGPYAQQQKMLLYVLPVVFAVGGIAFPIGVLIYWTTSNLWTMCQQFYVIRNNPSPNTAAFAAKQERDARRAARKGITLEQPGATTTGTTVDPVAPEAPAAPVVPPRQQPKKQTRSQRKKPAPRPGNRPPPGNRPRPGTRPGPAAAPDGPGGGTPGSTEPGSSTA